LAAGNKFHVWLDQFIHKSC